MDDIRAGLFHNKEEANNFCEEWERVTNMIKQKAKVNVEVEIPTVEEIIGEKVDSLTNLIQEQRKNCLDKYNIGIYNGLVLAKSVLTGEVPQYYEMVTKEEIINED